MTTYQISVIVGSLSKNSFNKRLAHAVIKLAPEHFKFHFVEIGDLPLFNQDDHFFNADGQFSDRTSPF